MAKLDPRLFREYDIRGVVPSLVDERSIYFGRSDHPDNQLATIDSSEMYQLGRAFAVFTQARKVFVGRDTRLSSPKFFENFTQGLLDQGADVFDGGLCTSSMVYFASGNYDFDAAVNITASHATREINGLKMTTKGVNVIGGGNGMEEFEQVANSNNLPSAEKGTLNKFDILNDYLDHVLKVVDISAIKNLKVVFDGSNGPIGLPASKMIAKLPIEAIKLNFEPDGSFPHHDPNPQIEKNRAQIEEEVKNKKADLGIIWDSDADRMVLITEKGEAVPTDLTSVLIAKYFLEKNPGASIVYNVPISLAVKEWVEKLGGKAYMERTGHAFIKRKNREVDAIFAAEHSGHFYFKDTYYAENDLLPALIILSTISKSGKPISEIIAGLGAYFLSGEINFEVADKNEVLERLKKEYKDAPRIYFLDGVSAEFPDWHFNVRPSANDPVIRLNLETKKKEDLQDRVEEVSKIIGGKVVSG